MGYILSWLSTLFLVTGVVQCVLKHSAYVEERTLSPQILESPQYLCLNS